MRWLRRAIAVPAVARKNSAETVLSSLQRTVTRYYFVVSQSVRANPCSNVQLGCKFVQMCIKRVRQLNCRGLLMCNETAIKQHYTDSTAILYIVRLILFNRTYASGLKCTLCLCGNEILIGPRRVDSRTLKRGFHPTQRTQRKGRNKMASLLDRPITAASDDGVCR